MNPQSSAQTLTIPSGQSSICLPSQGRISSLTVSALQGNAAPVYVGTSPVPTYENSFSGATTMASGPGVRLVPSNAATAAPGLNSSVTIPTDDASQFVLSGQSDDGISFATIEA
jgi:hypothetical protein